MPAADPAPHGIIGWLRSPKGRTALEAAERAMRDADGDPLLAGTRLRDAGLSPDQAVAALDQATLRRLAFQRGMQPGPGALLTRDGLEAATGPAVARHRAEILRAAGARRVLDLTGGLGFDTGAFLAAGLAVTAVERDPGIAGHLAHNQPAAVVVNADCTHAGVLAGLLADLDPTDVVFVDPARRDPSGARDAVTARARPERDPERWSPPWSWVAGIPHPRIAVKAAPGFSPPEAWQAQWVSVDRTVVECAAYSWDATGHARSAAVVLRGEVRAVIAAGGEHRAAADRIGATIHEVDPAVSRAGALPALAALMGLASLGPSSSWLTGDEDVSHPALRSFRVIAQLAGPSRDRRRQLTDLGITRASVKCRDVDIRPAQVLRDLGLSEGTGPVIAVTRLSGGTVTIVAEPLQSAS